jgi:hypothetical protein
VPALELKLRALALAFGSLFVTGCAAQRLVAPERPGPAATEPIDLTDIRLAIRSFDVTNQSPADVRSSARDELKTVFIAYLGRSASYGLVIPRGEGLEPADEDEVALDVMLHVDEDSSRTIIFDGLFFYPFLGTLPFTPMWGHAIVDANVRLVTATSSGAAGRPEPPIALKVLAPYSMIFYSWYRTGPIEDAFQRAHAAVFDELAQRIAERLWARKRELARAKGGAQEREAARVKEASGVVVSLVSTASSTSAAPLAPASYVPTPPPAADVMTAVLAMRAAMPRPSTLKLRPQGFGVVDEPFRREGEPGLLERYVGALGGVEGAITRGSAHVESRATSNGLHQVVGSGNAQSKGYRISLYKPPDHTGFFYPPIIGALSQDIDISGFREDVPLFIPEGTNTIPAVASDPATGLPVDADEPIQYKLKMKSGFIGQGLGLNLVLGTEDVQVFGTIRGSINLFEVRHSDVQINQSRVDGMSVAFFQSGAFGAQIGFVIPDWHVAVRGAVDYEWYAAFDYPHPVEFQAKVAFNPQKQVFERERVFVEGASLQTLDWQFSVIGMF